MTNQFGDEKTILDIGQHFLSGTLTRLKRDAGQLQVKIGKRVVLRYMPKLNFRIDDSIERGVQLLSVIQGIDEEAAARQSASEIHVDPDEEIIDSSDE